MVVAMHWEATSGSWRWREADCNYGSVFSQRVIISWHRLPGYVVDASSVNSFKKIYCMHGSQMWKFKLRFYPRSYKLQFLFCILMIHHKSPLPSAAPGISLADTDRFAFFFTDKISKLRLFLASTSTPISSTQWDVCVFSTSLPPLTPSTIASLTSHLVRYQWLCSQLIVLVISLLPHQLW